MPKVKVYLNPGESDLDADLTLLKAISHHVSGDAHSEKFQDPAMDDVALKLQSAHRVMYDNLTKEIITVLEAGQRGNLP